MIARKLTGALFTSAVVILLFALMAPYVLDGVKINHVSGYAVKFLGYVMVLTLYVVPVVVIYGTIAALFLSAS